MTPAAIVSLLVEVSWRSILVAALVGGVLLIWRVKGGAVRHAAWTAVMAAMLLMPALLVFVPELPVPLPVAEFRESSPARLEVRPLPESPQTTAPTGALPAPSMSSVPVPTSASDTATIFTWPQLVLGAWLAGIVFNLVVMVMGWRLARRLIATARVSDIDPRVMESPTVAAPCAVGLWRVQVLVPQAWRTWSRAGRDAVLQHELAHVSRRDLFVLFVARVNRAIFWFHPVAWWLERRIAATAEQACDEAVLQTGQDPQGYASVLVDMANALRTSGTRVAWQSLGMAEGTDLESRIDRVLTGEVPRLSRSRIVGVMTMSSVAMVIAVACTQAPPELAVNPEITARMERDVESRSASAAARSISPEEVRALTEQVLASPDDRALVQRLRNYYSAQRGNVRPGTAFVPSTQFLESHRRVVLWAIEHKPESSLAEWLVPKAADPAGYDAARTLWSAHLLSPDVTAGSLDQAISFTLVSDPAAAERMVLDARRRFPRVVKTNGELGGSAERHWAERLGHIYASVILGSYEAPHFFSAPNPTLAASPEAQRARAILDSSTDAFLIGAAGEPLSVRPQPHRAIIDFDVRALGRAYLRRSLQLNPDQPTRQQSLERKEWQELRDTQNARVHAVSGVNVDQLTPEQALALPEDLQWTTLPYLAERAYATAMSRGFQNTNDSEWTESLRRATLYSNRAIVLLERRSDPSLPRLRYQAHVVRGFAAIAENDRALAITHLNAAVDALAEKPMTLMDGRGPLHTLTNYLIKAGDTGPVADAFERIARVSDSRYPELQQAVEDLRAGRMSDQYQRMVKWLETQRKP